MFKYLHTRDCELPNTGFWHGLAWRLPLSYCASYLSVLLRMCVYVGYDQMGLKGDVSICIGSNTATVNPT